MAGNIIEVSDKTFQQDVVSSNTPVVVDFWAPWCGPCRQIAPVLEELSGTYAGKVQIAKVNVDNNKQTASQLRIQGIPTLVAYKGGVEVGRMVGFNGRGALETFIRKLAE